MIRKLFFGVVGIVLLGLIIGSFQSYRTYRRHQAEERARAQEQAAPEVTVTLIEGWTVDQMTDKLADSGVIKADEFTKALNNFDTKDYIFIDRPAKASLEGYLFPDTYRFAKDSTSEAIIAKLLSNFEKKVSSAGVKEGQKTFTIPGYEDLEISGADREPGLSLYDLLTLASIVEKESGGKGSPSQHITLDQERRMIAGVFYNRLNIGKALESDATVNYATGKSTPAASSEDLTVNSPYNTYKYPGLPPGPICNPSLASIQAVLNPIKTDYYYFLHYQPSGEVDFSKTFDEHRQKKFR